MEEYSFQRSLSSPERIFDQETSGDSLSLRRRKNYSSTRSISMATIQAQVSLAQSLRSLFQAARDPETEGNDTHLEDAWLQAVYNVIVFAIFGVIVLIGIAVYYILEPFLHPLLWAVLIGAFLFPFKHSATVRIEQWLTYFDVSGIPLSVGVFLSPFSFFNHLSTQFEYYITSYWKHFLALTGSVVTFYLSYRFNLLSVLRHFVGILDVGFDSIDQIVSYTWFMQLAVFLLCLAILLLCFASNSQTSYIIKGIVVTQWYLITVTIANRFFGYVGLPLVTVLFLVSLLVWVIRSQVHLKSNESIRRKVSRRKQSIFEAINESIVERGLGIMDNIKEEEEEESEHSEEEVKEDIDPLIPLHYKDQSLKRRLVHFKSKSVEERTPSPEKVIPSWYSSHLSDTETHGVLKNPYPDEQDADRHDNTTDQIFLLLISAYMSVILWRNLWLLFLVAPLVIWSLVKKPFLRMTSIYKHILKASQFVTNWFKDHRDLLCPQPLPYAFLVCKALDNKILRFIKLSVGPLMSITIVIGLLVGSVGIVVFFVFEIQLEIVYTINLAKQLLNSSVVETPWIHSLLGGAVNDSNVHLHIEQFADQGYHYGRDWLGNQVKTLLNDSGNDNTAIVEQILQLYDNFYHLYVFKNVSTITDSVRNITHNGLKEKVLHEAKHIVSDNLETILTIVKTLWSLVSMNFSIGLTIITSLSSFIFSGGTMVINFIVFITTLFYLLAYSDDSYLPVHWILSTLPSFVTESSDGDYADTFTKVIQGVFHTSFKRAVFYGLYTWLILSVLGMEMTILPSVLAAFTGAVPFVGPYWLGVPAILQLWLVEDSPVLAVISLFLFIIPPLTIDSLINSEIQGSHPYLTGLAIAGGMYFAGLEGAIFGPILLCCLLFAVNLLTVHL